MKIQINTFFLMLLLMSFSAFGQSNSKDLAFDINIEGQRISQMLNLDSSFVEQMEATLIQVERDSENDSINEILLQRLLTHFQSIQNNNKSRVKSQFEESLFTWMLPFTQFLEAPEENQSKIISGFPDTYFAAKILAPELLSEEALKIVAESYPKEVLHMIRYMVNVDAKTEAEIATLSAPYEAKQYLNYSNYVHSALKTSTDKRIETLFKIYDEYRYGSKSFYLLDNIYKKEISIAQAHDLTQQREKLYNALVDIYKDEEALGRYSAEEMLSELSDKYTRKLMFQRYLPASRLNLQALEQLSYDAKVYFLFSSQNLLKKKDLENLARLYINEEIPAIDESIIDWIPTEWIVQLNERIIEEKELQPKLSPIIKPSLWANLSKPTLPTEEVYVEEVIETEKEEVIEEEVFVFIPYSMSLSQAEKDLIKLENNPYELLEDLGKVTGKLYSRKMLMDLAETYPVEVMAQLDKFKNEPYVFDVCAQLAKSAPLTVKNYLIKKDHKIHQFLETSKDTAILTLYHIDSTLGNWTRAYILLDKIVNQELTYKEADSICKDKSLLLEQLIDIFTKPEYLGTYTVDKELEYKSLDFIRNFNISENTDREFSAKLLELDAKTIYTFLVFGEQEIISKTFYKMYDRLAAVSNGDFTSLFESMNYKYTDRFVRMAVHYGKEYDLFRRVKSSDELLAKIYKSLEDGGKNKVSDAIEAADIIVGINDRGRLHAIHEIIKSEYERLELLKHDEGVATYGILASILAQRQREQWSNAASAHFRIPNLSTIPVYSLFNEDLVNIQQYYFYNDRDGLYSYRNFVKQYESSNYNWNIEDKGLYIKISSKSGKAVEIYANKPMEGEKGIQALENHLKVNQLSPQVLVHRGLSTHTLKTFNRVPASTKLILDGSCGGFHIQSVALENAPGAQILCNRNIGTMYINDPMFKQISESIRQGKDIVWPSFWSEMEARLGTNPYFKDYIPPHKNVAAIILKAYYDVLGINN